MSKVTFEADREDADLLARLGGTGDGHQEAKAVCRTIAAAIRAQTPDPVVTFGPGQTVRSRAHPKQVYTLIDHDFYLHHGVGIGNAYPTCFRSDAYELLKFDPDTGQPTFLESTS